MTSTLEPGTTRDPFLAISNGMVRLFKETLGRGPRRARTSFSGPDSLLVVLEQTLTPAELTLAALGEYQRLHEVRLLIQSALEPRARALVEDSLRRPTLAFATGVDARGDVAAVFFTLGSRSAEPPADG